MKKKNTLSVAILSGMFIFLTSVVHPQESVLPADVGKNDVGVMEETPAAYVTPGNVTVNFKDADIKAVLNYFSEVAHVDIVPAPDVEGQITMKLTDKPWEVALDILVRNYGYVLVREGDVIRVAKKGALESEERITSVIKLRFMVPTRSLTPGIITTGKTDEEEEVATLDRGVEFVKGGGISEKMGGIALLQRAIEEILKEGESATFIPSANCFVVTAIPARVNRVKEMVEKVDVMPPQIMLEAKIVEVLLDKDERMGIDWNVVISAAGAKRPTTLPFEAWSTSWLGDAMRSYLPYPQLTGTTGAAAGGGGAVTSTTPADFPPNRSFEQPFPFVDADQFTFGTLDFSQFNAVLQMISQRDGTSILASPRVTTLNNQEAYIKVAREIFLAEVESTSETGGSIGTRIETEPREVGVFLQVIPHINEGGQISVILKPRADGDLTFQTMPIAGGQGQFIMQYTTRTAETLVMVNDGETVFIGGLINETLVNEDHKLPLLGDLFGEIPFVGKLFKYKSENVKKTEVVIFVTVHIVKDLKELNRLGAKGFSKMEKISEFLVKEAEGSTADEKTEKNNDKHKPLFDFRKDKK